MAAQPVSNAYLQAQLAQMQQQQQQLAAMLQQSGALGGTAAALSPEDLKKWQEQQLAAARTRSDAWQRSYRIFCAEWGASMIFCFVWWLNRFAMAGSGAPGYMMSLIQAIAVFTGTLLSMSCFMPYSNAHINPFVTLFFALWTRKVSWWDFGWYFMGQFVGAWTAFAMLVFTFWSTKSEMWNILVLVPGDKDATGYLLDICVNIVFFVVIFYCYLNRDVYLDEKIRAEVMSNYTLSWNTIWIATAYFAMTLISSSFTQSPINWFLAFIPAIVSGNFNTHQIYVVGPISAILLIGGVMRLMVYLKLNGDNSSYDKMYNPGWGLFGENTLAMRTIGGVIPPVGVAALQPEMSSSVAPNTGGSFFPNKRF